jgi:hypothetical protein
MATKGRRRNRDGLQASTSTEHPDCRRRSHSVRIEVSAAAEVVLAAYEYRKVYIE